MSIIGSIGNFFNNASMNTSFGMTRPMSFPNHINLHEEINRSSYRKNPGFNVDDIILDKTQNKSALNDPVILNYSDNRALFSNINLHQQEILSSISGDNIERLKNNRFENNFKLPSSIIDSFNRYKFVFNNAIGILTDVGGLEENLSRDENGREYLEKGKPINGQIFNFPSVPSLFNPLYGVHIVGFTNNVPLLNMTSESNVEYNYLNNSLSYDKKNVVIGTPEKDLSDCSIKKLVELSKPGPDGIAPLGRSLYKYADFMYCKDLGKVSNNHLITLRRFASPIMDNIWLSPSPNNEQELPDIGRLVCYLGEENKIENILNFKYEDTFVPREADAEYKQSEEDSEDGGIIGSVLNLTNPSYRRAVEAGATGSGNKLLSVFTDKFQVTLPVIGNTINNKGQYESNEVILGGKYDANKIYTKKGTVQDTHLYEGKLKFENSFSLVFDYELRAYDNINPKSAFLDLLGNILAVTYKRGSFWGGEQRVYGAPRNQTGWNKAELFINQEWDKLGGFFESLLSGNVNWNDIWGGISNMIGQVGNIAGQLFKGGIDLINGWDPNATETETQKSQEVGRKIIGAYKQLGLGSIFKGMLKNSLGRPAVYAFNSLLSGEPVGLWHVTIGNPRNPIVAMGNLILKGSTLQQYGPLGIDDFPTGIRLTVNLQHAKSRDAVEIAKMYTKGVNGIYFPFTDYPLENWFNVGKITEEQGKSSSMVNTKDGDTSGVYTPENILKLNDNIGEGVGEYFNTSDPAQIIANIAATRPG